MIDFIFPFVLILLCVVLFFITVRDERKRMLNSPCIVFDGDKLDVYSSLDDAFCELGTNISFSLLHSGSKFCKSHFIKKGFYHD